MSTEVDAIVFHGVSISFGAVRALDDVGFRVPIGSITGLIGRNGAGKSTAIRLMAGLHAPGGDDPVVELFGRSPRDERQRILAATGFLLSDNALFAYLTAAETLHFIGRANGLSGAETERRMGDLLHIFGLVEAADRYVDDFSTGMGKRLALAVAMIHAPRLLILDEPFEALDPLMVRALKRLLVAYRDGGGTVLLSSHLIDAVDEICDRIVILEQGRVVSAGVTVEVRAGVAERLPSATLEDLYASLVPDERVPDLAWLAPDGSGAK